jgi:hypothetical protein
VEESQVEGLFHLTLYDLQVALRSHPLFVRMRVGDIAAENAGNTEGQGYCSMLSLAQAHFAQSGIVSLLLYLTLTNMYVVGQFKKLSLSVRSDKNKFVAFLKRR